MNSVNIVGNITRDPELRQITSDFAVCEFGLAINGQVKQNGEWVDYPNFFDVKFFGKKAEVISKHFCKGKKIGVTGKLKQERWESDAGKRSKVVIEGLDFTFVEPKSLGEQHAEAGPNHRVPVAAGAPGEDEVPF